MKRSLLITLLFLFSAVCFGQNSGPLKFLGIPIDGTEAQFASKLKAKGFTYSAVSEGYKGQFNGKNVDVFIHTNHNLVDRVYVAFPYTNEESIKTEFNRLLRQFEENDKYMDLVMNDEIFCLGESFNRCFGGGICRLTTCALLSPYGRDVDYRAAAAREHIGKHRLGREKHALCVDVEHVVPSLLVKVNDESAL